MPLKPGKKNISYNIRELMHSYEEDGKIGNIRPRNREHALRIAIAIAMKKARQKNRR